MILVVTNHLTKMALFIPCHKEATTLDLADLFLCNVFVKHGTPTDIVSDHKKLITSQFWLSLCNRLHIKSNLSTAYHLETDSQMECINQIIEQYLCIYVHDQQDNWSSLLPLAEFAYNNTTCTATSVSPFFTNKAFTLKSTFLQQHTLCSSLAIGC